MQDHGPDRAGHVEGAPSAGSRRAAAGGARLVLRSRRRAGWRLGCF